MYILVRDQTDNATYALTGWVPAVREDKDALPCVRRYSCLVPAGWGGGIVFILRVIRRHFLVFEDVAGGSSCQPHRLKSSSDGCPSLTTPRREHQGGGDDGEAWERNDAEPGKTR